MVMLFSLYDHLLSMRILKIYIRWCIANRTKQGFPDFLIISRPAGHFFKANHESSALILTPALGINQPSTLGKEPQLLCRKMKNGLNLVRVYQALWCYWWTPEYLTPSKRWKADNTLRTKLKQTLWVYGPRKNRPSMENRTSRLKLKFLHAHSTYAPPGGAPWALEGLWRGFGAFLLLVLGVRVRV